MFGVIYTYRCILTNNWTSTEKDIITFYNERGASEKNFDIQNNDFGWSHLPFSFMAENMVFMMITAMLKNFYLYLVRHISEKVKPLKKISRLKAFILHFVSVPAKWVRTERQNILNLYTNKASTLKSSLNKQHFFVFFILHQWFGWGDFMPMQDPGSPEKPHINI